ncbi:hypothetical protein PAEPH01_0809 [Pancytospora epiphaga]|nr:hypothetical protein PAEPH01_0809 [Pancytospora epiphaga]
MMILIEVGITGQDKLMTVETEKKRMHAILPNKLSAEMRCKTKIIPYVMAWDDVVMSYHKQYLKEIGLTDSIEMYTRMIVLKKTLETISYGHRRGSTQGEDAEEAITIRLDAGEETGKALTLLPEAIKEI